MTDAIRTVLQHLYEKNGAYFLSKKMLCDLREKIPDLDSGLRIVLPVFQMQVQSIGLEGEHLTVCNSPVYNSDENSEWGERYIDIPG